MKIVAVVWVFLARVAFIKLTVSSEDFLTSCHLDLSNFMVAFMKFVRDQIKFLNSIFVVFLSQMIS